MVPSRRTVPPIAAVMRGDGPYSPQDEESWAFIVEVYARPGVSEACLTLQDVADVDVTMLLTIAFWAARKGRRPDRGELAELDALCRPWREQILQPLRQVRVGLKKGPVPAPDRATNDLRERIKRDELVAEKVENGLLNAWFQRRQDSTLQEPRPDIAGLIHSVVALSTTPGEGTAGTIDGAIATIVAAFELSQDSGRKAPRDSRRNAQSRAQFE